MKSYTNPNINQVEDATKYKVASNSNSKLKQITNRYTLRRLTKKYTPKQFTLLMEIYLETSKMVDDTLQLSQQSFADRTNLTREYVNKCIALFIARGDLESFTPHRRSYTHSDRLFYRVPLESIYYRQYRATKASLEGMTAVSQQLFTHLMLYIREYKNININSRAQDPGRSPESLRATLFTYKQEKDPKRERTYGLLAGGAPHLRCRGDVAEAASNAQPPAGNISGDVMVEERKQKIRKLMAAYGKEPNFDQVESNFPPVAAAPPQEQYTIPEEPTNPEARRQKIRLLMAQYGKKPNFDMTC